MPSARSKLRGEWDGSWRLDIHREAARWVVDDYGFRARMRRCADCRLWRLESEDNYVCKQRNDAGRVLRFDSFCRDCANVKKRAKWADKSKEERSAHHQRRWERMQSDDAETAARLKRKRERNRKASKTWREKHPEQIKATNKKWRETRGADATRTILERQRLNYRLRVEQRTGRTVVNNVAPAANSDGKRFDSDAFPNLPALPLAKAIHKLIVAEQGPVRHPGAAFSSNDDGCMPASFDTVCERLGTTTRSLLAWTTGEREGVQFDIADMVLTRGDLLWWDVYNASTVRRHRMKVSRHRIRQRKTGGRRPFKGLCPCGLAFNEPATPGRAIYRVGTDLIEDIGPDQEALEKVEFAFTGEDPNQPALSIESYRAKRSAKRNAKRVLKRQAALTAA